MKSLLLALLLASAPLCAQTPDPLQTFPSDLGFSYALPADWQVMNSQATLPQVKQQATQSATTEEEKKGLECVQLLLTARHGTPASVVVEVALPFDCFGEQLSEKDLPGFATGASEGLTQSFSLGKPQYGSYSLGDRTFWIERAKGSPTAQPYLPPYTLEIACGLLQKAAVCWMTMASDDDALQAFERGPVTLDGRPPTPLVPPTAFQNKPM